MTWRGVCWTMHAVETAAKRRQQQGAPCARGRHVTHIETPAHQRPCRRCSCTPCAMRLVIRAATEGLCGRRGRLGPFCQTLSQRPHSRPPLRLQPHILSAGALPLLAHRRGPKRRPAARPAAALASPTSRLPRPAGACLPPVAAVLEGALRPVRGGVPSCCERPFYWRGSCWRATLCRGRSGPLPTPAASKVPRRTGLRRAVLRVRAPGARPPQ